MPLPGGKTSTRRIDRGGKKMHAKGAFLMVAVGALAAATSAAAAVHAEGGYGPPTTTATATTTPMPKTSQAPKTYELSATLSAREDVPHPNIPARARDASGRFEATMTLRGNEGTLAWRLTFAHLSGPATAAHIHLGAPGKAGPVAIPLCGPCSSPAHGTFHGPIGANAQLLHAILAGDTYVNVHTKLNPAGEIRGQVRARLVVPAIQSTRVARTTVRATEIQWGIRLSRRSAPAGEVTFIVRNDGSLDHQFLVLRTNLPVAKLPMSGAQVDVKKAGTLVGEISTLKPRAQATLRLELKPGRYVLFCNFPAHYQAGQRVGFRVA
jgi:uncharacterized cupredoxin-like copper-binding protein